MDYLKELENLEMSRLTQTAAVWAPTVNSALHIFGRDGVISTPEFRAELIAELTNIIYSEGMDQPTLADELAELQNLKAYVVAVDFAL